MARDSCLTRIAAGVAIGGAVGGAVGAVYGTYDAIRSKVVPLVVGSQLATYRKHLKSQILELYKEIPGLLKVRYIGQTTVGSAAVFGLFLGAGSLIHCGKSY